MPYQYFFVNEFNVAGDYPYYCIIHPWRFGVVHVSDELEAGNNFEFSSGTGVNNWNVSEFDRNLLKFEPTTVALEESTPASHYFTMFNRDTQRTVYSNFFPSTNNLLIGLISSDYNQTDTYGPDRGSTILSTSGAYHVQGNFIDPGVNILSVAVTAVDGQPLEQISADQFELEVIE